MATYYVSSYYQVCERHHPATPKLTQRQHEAFAEFDRLASSPELAMNWWVSADLGLLAADDDFDEA